jgi:hypothetical protein
VVHSAVDLIKLLNLVVLASQAALVRKATLDAVASAEHRDGEVLT